MPLDLVAAEHQKKIDGTRPVFSLEEGFHAELLASAIPGKDFPVVTKISDYYADNVILFGELEDFRKELFLIAGKSGGKERFSALLSFVDKAIAERDNLYVYAD